MTPMPTLSIKRNEFPKRTRLRHKIPGCPSAAKTMGSVMHAIIITIPMSRSISPSEERCTSFHGRLIIIVSVRRIPKKFAIMITDIFIVVMGLYYYISINGLQSASPGGFCVKTTCNMHVCVVRYTRSVILHRLRKTTFYKVLRHSDL